MKFLLEYKEYTEKTTKVEIVKHWLDYYFNLATENWLKTVSRFNDIDKQINWEEFFWKNFGAEALNLVLKRISFRSTILNSDIYSLIDTKDIERITLIAQNIFEKYKKDDYKNGLTLFINEFLDKLNREYLSQEGFNEN